MVAKGKRSGGGVGMNWECGIDRQTIPYIKQMNSKDLLVGTGSCIQYLVINYSEKEWENV